MVGKWGIGSFCWAPFIRSILSLRFAESSVRQRSPQDGLLQRQVRGGGSGFFKGQGGHLHILRESPTMSAKIAGAVDDMFRNSPQPTKTESEKAFGLSFVNMLGNVKAFILSICLAVVFTTLLVSANTMAMSIRERTREVAVLKTLGFERRTILGLFVGEAMSLSLAGGAAGCGFAWLVAGVADQTVPTDGAVPGPEQGSRPERWELPCLRRLWLDFLVRWCLPTMRRAWRSWTACGTSVE